MILGLQCDYFCDDVWMTQNVHSPITDTVVAVVYMLLCVIAGSSKSVVATYGKNVPIANYNIIMLVCDIYFPKPNCT